MIITGLKLDDNQRSQYHSEVKKFADFCSCAPVELIHEYCKESKMIMDGDMDNLMMKEMTVTEIAAVKRDRKFFMELGWHIIQTRETIKTYLKHTGVIPT